MSAYKIHQNTVAAHCQWLCQIWGTSQGLERPFWRFELECLARQNPKDQCDYHWPDEIEHKITLDLGWLFKRNYGRYSAIKRRRRDASSLLQKPMFSSLKITEDAHNSHAETHLFASTKALSQRFQTAAGEASKGPHLYSPSGCNGVGCFAFRDSQQEHILQ